MPRPGPTSNGATNARSARRFRIRFDDLAMGISAVILAWFCVYYIWYLLSPAWLGSQEQLSKMKLAVALFLAYRVLLFSIDSLRGQGTVLTRSPLLAFLDLLVLGALVKESWDEQLDSMLAPLVLVFLAIVPILYRNIRVHWRYVVFSVVLAFEAVLLTIPHRIDSLRERHEQYLENIVSIHNALERLPDLGPPPAPPANLMEQILEVPATSQLLNVMKIATSIDEHRALVESAREDAEATIEHALSDLDWAVRNLAVHRGEFDGRMEVVRDLRAALEREDFYPPRAVPEAAGSLREAFEEHIAYQKRMLASIRQRLERASLRLELHHLKMLTDDRRVRVDAYGVWMSIVLGFFVQFQIRRFVNRRIETERSRTLSEMLSERHRMDAQNWINLTAGLTHNIGNEVRGYDVYLEEIRYWLAEPEVHAPREIHEKVDFIYRTNQARLGFIQFLREFALLKQVMEDERPVPRGLRPIKLEKSLRIAHQRVKSIETSYNPADSTDPGDIRKRRKFLGTQLEVEWLGDGTPVTMQRGREAVLDFFFYELIKNALRNSSGQMPLTVTVQRVTLNQTVEVCFINDLLVEPAEPGICSSCRQPSGEKPRIVLVVQGKDPLCEPCLRQRVDQTLEGCFHPGRGSGTGLGLFVIKHFLEEYYHGFIHSGVESWNPDELRFMVYFRLVLPDDLAVAIQENNTLWSTAP